MGPVSPSSRAGMGSIPYPGGTAFRVWAPHAEKVFVAGDFNKWSKTENPLAGEGNGYWSIDVPNAKTGNEYKYIIINGPHKLHRIDPYARSVTCSKGNAIIHDAHFDWQTEGFQILPLNELVIYEMHVGTFNYQGKQRPGNLRSAIEKLPYLKELGINAVEVMPVMEFRGSFSWGYNPALIFAIESDYGGPTAFKDFLDAAHANGIAVIFDVVYNHFGPGDLDLWQFDGWSENNKGGIYFFNDRRCQTPWGETRPDYGREQVRQFIRDNALMWLQEYQVDGLRWDATAFIRNIYGNDNDPQNDIAEGWSLIQWINHEVKTEHPGKITIAEDVRNNPFITKPTGEAGAGFDAQWDGTFVRNIRQAIACPEDQAIDTDAVREAILHRYGENAFERVVYTESHDEVANGKSRVPEEVSPGDAGTWVAKKLSTLGAALVFTSPGIPMIFQGQEFLEDDWFHDKDPIDWSKREKYGGIVQLYRDLIRLRRNKDGNTRGLCGQNVDVHYLDNEAKIIAFHRYEKSGPGDSVIVVVNMKRREYQGVTIGFPQEGLWRVRFNSDGSCYDANFTNFASNDVFAKPGEKAGMPCWGKVDIGPYSVIILSQDSKSA